LDEDVWSLGSHHANMIAMSDATLVACEKGIASFYAVEAETV
jgi:hypothetical protein